MKKEYVLTAMTFAEFKLKQLALQADYKATCEALKKWDSERLPNGLTPDRVRALPDWQAAKRANVIAFEALRKFNGLYVGKFKKELRQEREAKRARMIAKLQAMGISLEVLP